MPFFSGIGNNEPRRVSSAEALAQELEDAVRLSHLQNEYQARGLMSRAAAMLRELDRK